MEIVMAAAALLILFCVGIIIADSNRFHKVSYRIKTDKVKQPFRFVFLSDLHNKSYGKQNERLLQAIDDASPDAVLIGGDILTARPGASLEPAINLTGRLAGKYQLYYANGNHEQRLWLYPQRYGSMAQDYEQVLSDIGVHRLVNESRQDEMHQMQITGCEIEKKYYRRFSKARMDKAYLDTILPQRRPDAFQILLAHNPDYFEAYAAWGADLVLSGHVHGGVVRIPGLGGVISTDFTLFPHYDGGVFRQGDKTMIVSRGLGAHTIPLRFCNPAELVEVIIEPLGQEV